MSLGSRIKQLRLSMGWTQSQLGEKISVTKASVSGYENDTRSPDKEILVKLAKIFNVTTDYLLGNNQTPKWASKDDVIELDKILESDAGMAFGDMTNITKEDREQINDLIASYFWRKKQKEERDKR